jgi:hypothetical protein
MAEGFDFEYGAERDLYLFYVVQIDRLCGLVVRVLDYRCSGPGFDSRALQKK